MEQTLDTLEVGDIFRLANDKKKAKTYFVVRGNPFYNHVAKQKVRYCSSSGSIVSKACKNIVVKVGESKNKEKYKITPLTPPIVKAFNLK